MHLRRAWGKNLSTKAGEAGKGGDMCPHHTHISLDLFSARNQETIALTSWTSYQVS